MCQRRTVSSTAVTAAVGHLAGLVKKSKVTAGEMPEGGRRLPREVSSFVLGLVRASPTGLGLDHGISELASSRVMADISWEMFSRQKAVYSVHCNFSREMIRVGADA